MHFVESPCNPVDNILCVICKSSKANCFLKILFIIKIYIRFYLILKLLTNYVPRQQTLLIFFNSANQPYDKIRNLNYIKNRNFEWICLLPFCIISVWTINVEFDLEGFKGNTTCYNIIWICLEFFF